MSPRRSHRGTWACGPDNACALTGSSTMTIYTQSCSSTIRWHLARACIPVTVHVLHWLCCTKRDPTASTRASSAHGHHVDACTLATAGRQILPAQPSQSQPGPHSRVHAPPPGPALHRRHCIRAQRRPAPAWMPPLTGAHSAGGLSGSKPAAQALAQWPLPLQPHVDRPGTRPHVASV